MAKKGSEQQHGTYVRVEHGGEQPALMTMECKGGTAMLAAKEQ